jgi:hypothetical protein
VREVTVDFNFFAVPEEDRHRCLRWSDGSVAFKCEVEAL